jgi:hypothetical protein
MGLNSMAKTSRGHLCLREENLNFNNNYIIKELNISIMYMHMYI